MHNLVNGFQRLPCLRPNPKTQYPNTKMIYQVQETCESISDYWPKHKYFNLFTKNKSISFTYLYVGIAKFGKCCDGFHFGTHVQVLLLWGKSNYYFSCLYAAIVNVGKTNTYRSQMTSTWFTKHMRNNAYDTQDISIWVTTHMIHKTIGILC